MDKRCVEGLQRLRHNTDFVAYKEYLISELEYAKEQLVGENDPGVIAQLQGKARFLQDHMKHIQQEE